MTNKYENGKLVHLTIEEENIHTEAVLLDIKQTDTTQLYGCAYQWGQEINKVARERREQYKHLVDTGTTEALRKGNPSTLIAKRDALVAEIKENNPYPYKPELLTFTAWENFKDTFSMNDDTTIVNIKQTIEQVFAEINAGNGDEFLNPNY